MNTYDRCVHQTHPVTARSFTKRRQKKKSSMQRVNMGLEQLKQPNNAGLLPVLVLVFFINKQLDRLIVNKLFRNEGTDSPQGWGKWTLRANISTHLSLQPHLHGSVFQHFIKWINHFSIYTNLVHPWNSQLYVLSAKMTRHQPRREKLIKPRNQTE